jgi:hypothetical protein
VDHWHCLPVALPLRLAVKLQGPFKFAEHVLGCMQCSKGLGVGNPRLIRHSLMLPVLADLYRQS